MRRTILAIPVLSILAAEPASAANFVVTSKAKSGPGTLAQAILDANATPAADTISFALPGTSVQTILSDLPDITAPVTIDGYTQPGSIENGNPTGSLNSVLKIALDASLLLASGDAMLRIKGDDVVIRGVAIHGMNARTSGIRIDAGAERVRIEGCRIGTLASGLVADSSGDGIVTMGTEVRVGSNDPADRNLVSGNAGTGIALTGGYADVRGSLIGVGADGGSPLPNRRGIDVRAPLAGDSFLGGGDTAANEIAFNEEEGVRIVTDAAVSTLVTRNSIHDNGGLGIDIGEAGVTPNDEFEADAITNYPVLTFARLNDGGVVTIEGWLQGAAGSYEVDFFVTAEADASGYGEGQYYIGEVDLHLATDGEKKFFRRTLTPSVLPLLPLVVTATATRSATISSSEFSNAVELLKGGEALVVSNSNDTGSGSFRNALVLANGDADVDTIVFEVPGDGLFLAPGLAYPSISKPLIIDGYTQSGAHPNTLAEGSDAEIRVGLVGTSANAFAAGLYLGSPGIVVRGLAVHGFGAAGLRLSPTAEGARIQGNFLGLSDSGTSGSGSQGVGVDGSDDPDGMVVGGPGLHHRNIVSGNGTGILVGGSGAVVQNNLVGPGRSGTTIAGTQTFGLSVHGTDALIGSEDGLAGNVIRGNTAAGINVGEESSGNRIVGNRIFDNGGLGIDLREPGNVGGATVNDPDDTDAGANGLQNFPALSPAQRDDDEGGVRIPTFLDVPADALNRDYVVSVYSASRCDESGRGQGETFLGTSLVTLSADAEEFEAWVPVDPPPQHVLVVTATYDATGDTSEFSACTAIGACGDPNASGSVTAADALQVLRAAVGAGHCVQCICDVNASGSTSATDALVVLRRSVGQDVALDCPPCA